LRTPRRIVSGGGTTEWKLTNHGSTSRVIEGYAILQPRASISLTSAGQTWFSKLFAGEAGIDPYTR